MNDSYKPPLEIERKYIVLQDAWRSFPIQESIGIYQGYLTAPTMDVDDGNKATVRVRLINHANTAYVTVKGRGEDDISRAEFEYAIPHQDARYMLEHLCGGRVVKKTRHVILADESMPGLKWEVDEFHGENHGLVVAEIEIPDPNYSVSCPIWIKGEATKAEYKRLSNFQLAVRPFAVWPEAWKH
jgi:adenylate cyclase